MAWTLPSPTQHNVVQKEAEIAVSPYCFRRIEYGCCNNQRKFFFEILMVCT